VDEAIRERIGLYQGRRSWCYIQQQSVPIAKEQGGYTDSDYRRDDDGAPGIAQTDSGSQMTISTRPSPRRVDKVTI